jgi:ribonucleoside-diphosphate reductase alpha chain
MDNDILIEVNPLFERIAKERSFYSVELMRKIAEQSSIQNITEIPEDIRQLFRTAHDISPEAHIRMQSAFQKHCDNAVSKTVNFSHDSTPEHIAKVFWLDYESGCKGATVFRDRCRETQVLNVSQKPDEEQLNIGELSGKKAETITPRKRGRITYGATEKIPTGEGTLYVTINQDEHGLCEVFTNIGKHGTDVAAWSEAVGRLISLCLRSGISLDSIVKQLRGITSRPIWYDGIQILSVPDAIGLALSRYLTSDGMQLRLEFSNQLKLSDVQEEFHTSPQIYEACPDCGSPVEHESGCLVCRICGFSKCG